jgi:hypothetical protein
LHHVEHWQSVSATGGGMVLGHAWVPQGEEQETRMQETA